MKSIDRDGTNSGFDIEPAKHVREAVTIPVIASSGAGKVEHFSEVFEKTDVEAVLAAGIFHREEVPIEAVKKHMRDKGRDTINSDSISAHRKALSVDLEGALVFVNISPGHVDSYFA